MQKGKRVAKNTGILYIRMALTVFISLYSIRLILSALGASDFGILNVVGGAVAMLTFLNTSMASASQRFMSYAQGEGNNEKQKNIFNVSIVLHFIIAILVVLILEVAGYYLFNGILQIPDGRITAAKIIFQFMLMSTFFTILSVPYDAVINAHENMLLIAILGIIQALIKLLIAIYITNTTFDKLIIFGLLTALLSVLLIITKRIYCQKKYEEVQINIKKHFSRSLFKEMISFAGWSFLSATASILTMQGMTIVLNSFFGVIVNAAQGVANQISGQLMSFSTTMLQALNPVIVKSEGENNRDQMLKASIFGNKLSYFLLTFVSIPVLLEMPFIYNLWLIKVPNYAIIFSRLVLIRLFFSQLTITLGTAIGATGNIKSYSIWTSIIHFALLPLSSFMFILGAPPEIIYLNLIVMVIALDVVKIYFTNKTCGLNIIKYLKNVVLRCLSTSLVTIILASVPLFFMPMSMFRLAVVCILAFITFITFMYLFGLTFQEKLLIKTMRETILLKMKSYLLHNLIFN